MNNDIWGKMILWGFGVGLVYYFMIKPIGEFFERATNWFASLFTPMVIRFLFMGLIIFIIWLIFYLYTRIVISIKKYKDEKEHHQTNIEKIESRIKRIFDLKLESFNYPQLKGLASQAGDLHEYSIEYSELDNYTSLLKDLLKKIRGLIEDKEHEARKAEQEKEKRRRELILEDLDKKIYLKQMVEEDKKRELLNQLNIYEHPVFRKDSLNEKQIIALLEDGYSKVNEYCIIKKKLVTFLIKPVSNHSRTHTFLVWNVRELLKRMDGVDKVREHESVDADLTFKYKSKIYALEIETGTLLGKKKQTQDKIDFLNLKYPKRWFFIVSNKTLLPKYSKLGSSTQRNGVLEKLQKMLK